MEIPFAIFSVFTDRKLGFKGNTAAVTLLKDAIAPDVMQSIAADMCQPATTFLWPGNSPGEFYVRWFAPDGEIGLCGHGSLAALAYLSRHLSVSGTIKLHYKNGLVSGRRADGEACQLYMAPIPVISEEPVTETLRAGLGIPISGHYKTGDKHIVMVESEDDLKGMKPDFARLRTSEIFGYAVTAKGNEADFVSRTIIPHVRQLEDPATGSSHAALVPFWSRWLGRDTMRAYQLSSRGGKFDCQLKANTVILTGQFEQIAEGNILAVEY